MKSAIKNLCILFALGVSPLTQAASVVTYYHNDYLGSPAATTNEHGEKIFAERYTPFGDKVKNEDSNNGNDIGYTGHLNDRNLGLTYMQARYYDPVIGRFLANDPVLFSEKNPVQSFNRYVYANNNPYAYTDPDGEFINSIIGAIVGASLDLALQVKGSVESGDSVIGALKKADYESVAVSASLGFVTGGGSTLVQAGLKGTIKVGSEVVNLTSKSERIVIGLDGISKVGAVGAIQAGRKDENMLNGSAAKIADSITKPVPTGTITSKALDYLESKEAETKSESENNDEKD